MPTGPRRFLACLAFAITSLALLAETPAQDTATPPSGDIALPGVEVRGLLEQPYNQKSSTVGTKIDAPLRDIPQSIQVIPRGVIDDQRALSLGDVLRNVSGFSPAVNSQSQRFGERNAIFRGFTGNNYYTNSFKDPFNGSSFTFGLFNVDRVEVLKGPASVLYGLGEPGATINIVTKQPLVDWYAAASLTAGSYGHVSPSIDVSGPLTPSKQVLFRFNAGYQRADSFVDQVESQRYLLAPVLALRLSPGTLLTLEGEYQEIGETYYTGLPAAGTIQKNVNGELPRSRYLGDAKLEGETDFPERRLGKVGYRLDHRFNEAITLRHGFRATYLSRLEHDVIPGTLGADQRTMSRTFNELGGGGEDYYILTDLTADVRTGPLTHKLLVGADQRFNRLDSTNAQVNIPSLDIFNPVYGNIPNTITKLTPKTISSTSLEVFGFYVQDLVTILEQVKLLAGGRYDLASQTTRFRNTGTGAVTLTEFDAGVFSPRAGVVYQPIAPLAVYFSYSKSFNPLAGATFDGSAFEPERGEQFEGGVKLDFFGGRLSSTAALYQLTRQNVLTSDPAHPGFSIQVGEVRSRGFEIDVAGEVLPGLRVIGGYAHTDAEILLSNTGTQGNTPANVPRHSGSLWGVYDFRGGPLRGLGLGFGLFAAGERPANDLNTATLPGYIRADAAVYYKLGKHLDLALNVRNLFNKHYFETSTFSSINNGIAPGAPISVFGTVTARY